MLLIVISLLGFKLALGCPAMTVMEDFDVYKYLGLWFQRTVYTSGDAMDIQVKCVSADYHKEGNEYMLLYSAINFKENEWISERGQLKFSKDAKSEKEAKLEEVIFNTTRPYWVLDTDYDTYSVVYSCQDNIDIDYRVWILIRDLFPKTSEEDRLFKKTTERILIKHNIPTTTFTNIDQKNCFI